MGLFRKKDNRLYAFANGTSVAIEDVPDEVFSTRMMGDGIAILPAEGMLYAPCDGHITMIMDHFYHAIGIINDDGIEILLHVGLDSVNLMGEGFHVYVEKQQHVRKGEPLLRFDQELMKQKEIPDISMMVIVEKNGHHTDVPSTPGVVEAGKTCLIEYS